MTPVPMQCPLCAGLIQIDPAHAGQQVGCPLCQGVMVLPPPEFFGQMADPQAGYPPQFPPEASAPLPQLGCPMCGGAFQVSPEMAGQQVACPHCQNVVSIPNIFGGDIPPYPPPQLPPPEMYPQQSLQFIGLPRGFGGPEIPMGMAVSVAAQPAPVELTREAISPADDTNLYPPGMRPKETASRPPETGREKLARNDRFPPGQEKQKKSRGPDSSPRDKPIATKPVPVAPVQEQAPQVDDLLPPGAAPASAVEALLPPGAADASPSAAEPDHAARGQTVVDALLPPGAPTDPTAVPTEQVALPDAPPPAPRPIPAPTPGRLILPTPDGDYVSLENKEVVTTIKDKGQEIEIRKLSPEERSRRRRVKNIVMFILAMLVLAVVIVMMTRK